MYFTIENQQQWIDFLDQASKGPTIFYRLLRMNQLLIVFRNFQQFWKITINAIKFSYLLKYQSLHMLLIQIGPLFL